MIFTTFAFLVFFVVVFGLYVVLRGPGKRHALLLVSSSFFYGWWDYRYLALMWIVILISYLSGRMLGAGKKKDRAVVAGAIALQLCLLSVFKYSNFFLESAQGLSHWLGYDLRLPLVTLILPIGISFYIFHGISYVVDVYRGVIPAQRSLMRVALYISFFPQLVAGPIVRAVDFIPQLERDVVLNKASFVEGIREFTIGFIYKAAFADHLAQFVDRVLGNINAYDNHSLIWAMLGFYGQIYFDFAGYSLMAIGLARILGYEFRANFRHPYGATSVTDFWHRWHISLSTWLRNYLYFSLGGNRLGKAKQYRNLMITMLLGGLWHGASWNFVLWGGLQGVALVVHKAFQGEEPSGKQNTPRIHWVLVSWLVTQVFVLLCWVPFRLPAFSQTLEVYQAFIGWRAQHGLTRVGVPYLLICLPLVVDTLFGLGTIKAIQNFYQMLPERPRAIALSFGLGLAFAIALTLIPLDAKPFIYFQF